MDKQKSALVEALTYKGCALCLIYRANKNNVLAGDASSSSKTLDSIEQVWNSLISLVDQNDHKVSNNLKFFKTNCLYIFFSKP